jgi:murein DD-endopeptidase MepM/ murein hydrolase activator NlpD
MTKNNKYFTVLIVPEKAARVKKLHISKLSVQIALGFLGSFIIAASVMTYLYFNSLEKMSELRSLREVTQNQRLQIMVFSDQIDELKKNMARIKQFDSKLRNITNLESGSSEGMLGLGGPMPDDEGYFSGKVPNTARIQSEVDQLKSEVKVREKSLQEITEYIEDKKSLLASTPSVWPTRGWVTSGFGNRIYPFTGERRMHEGLDIAASYFTPVVSVADGIVTLVGEEDNYGRTVVVDHGYGYSTRFGHLQNFFVRVGQKVRRGQKIGTVGNTGKSTGPHLHYEVRVNGVPTNPKNYILD